MPNFTNHYRLEKLQAGESFSANSYQFTTSDRDTIDTILSIGAEGHHHTGISALATTVSSPPTLVLGSAGSLPAGVNAYYKVSLVDPNGLETAASPEAFIAMPPAVVSPGAATVAPGGGFGTLTHGLYYYALSAYTTISTSETLVGPLAFINLATSNDIQLTFPSLPAGADGFNIYRQSPGETTQFFLASVDMTVMSPPTGYYDNGGSSENCDRRIPTINNTESSNSVEVTLPVALPALGWTWKIYRTLASNNYSNSLLHNVIETTVEFGTIVVTSYIDIGLSTTSGQPSNVSRIIGSPSKVDLVDEVQGKLPLGSVNYFPVVVTFAFTGQQIVVEGKNIWVCEYPNAYIVGARASLGRGYSPNATDFIVDVNKGLLSMGSYTVSTIYTTQANRPTIPVGGQVSTRMAPDVTSMQEGDFLSVDVDQAGAGSNTDKDLTVNVTLLVSFTNLIDNEDWS